MKKIVVFAFFCSALVISMYISKFGYVISDDHSRWSDFGSFIGGTLGPMFTFCSLLYLAFQVEMQWKENRRAREENDRVREDIELSHRERNIETNLKLLVPMLSSTDSTINTSLAELIVSVYRSKSVAELI
ncbi:hypothetical protein [Vibrio paucivorans]|uniref:Uncharacterized protein n=1 Tax=Vibrio paucivorans TaxID=2829489 RepID=A0A9X3CBD2_9VIBR|nr:hypothetical protein [Vibrio paucivorans]MCW8332603.1 hypothetical protein [Vibrio paucivorans]